MITYRYAIVGGGMAAAAAVKGIRRHDRVGSIGLLSMDRYPPYDRPPLSKQLWTGEKTLEHVWSYGNARSLAVTEHLSTQITRLDPAAKRLFDQHGREYGYDKLLLATGGTPITLPTDSARVVCLRTLDDYLAIWRWGQPGQSVVIVGGGFIGAELAAALVRRGATVAMVFPEHGILGRILPRDLSDHVTAGYLTHGVNVAAGETVHLIEDRGAQVVVRTEHRSLEGQLVVLGLGIRANTQLARDAGLAVDQGIVVNQRGETSAPDIWAAGDAAEIPAPSLNRTVRVEHEDNAVVGGRVAGENMAGGHATQDDLPFFYSDLFDVGFEAVGILRSDLDTVAAWTTPFEEGVIYYRDDAQRVVGVLNWNVWDGVANARRLLGGPVPSTPGPAPTGDVQR